MIEDEWLPPPALSQLSRRRVWLSVTGLVEEDSVSDISCAHSVLECAACELLQSLAQWEWPVLTPTQARPSTGLHMSFICWQSGLSLVSLASSLVMVVIWHLLLTGGLALTHTITGNATVACKKYLSYLMFYMRWHHWFFFLSLWRLCRPASCGDIGEYEYMF